MQNDADAALRKQLLELLDGGHAHIRFDEALKGFPVARAGERPAGSPHSAWELLEHIRIAQRDILEFSNPPDGRYVELKWPDDYWPPTAGPSTPSDWTNSVKAISRDLEAFKALIADTSRDLNNKFAWGKDQTLLRESLVLADHNSYHLGQLMLVRKMLEGNA